MEGMEELTEIQLVIKNIREHLFLIDDELTNLNGIAVRLGTKRK